jgi:hypothetical protein
MMTWVIASPLRDDAGYFCGCPPCGLCYDWADGDEITEGVIYIARQLLGRKRVTQEERAKVIAGLKLAHDAIRARDAKAIQDHDDAQQEKRIALQTKGIIRAAVKKKIPKKKRNVVLDEVKVPGAKPKKEPTIPSPMELPGRDKQYEDKYLKEMVTYDSYARQKAFLQRYGQDPFTPRLQQAIDDATARMQIEMQKLKEQIDNPTSTIYDRMLAQEALIQMQREKVYRR